MEKTSIHLGMKGAGIFMVTVLILGTGDFSLADTPQQKLTRIAIIISGFAVMYAGFRFWMSPGGGRTSTPRLMVLAATLILGLPFALFVLPAFLGRHPDLGDAYDPFLSSSTFEWVVAPLMAILVVVYSVVKKRASRS